MYDYKISDDTTNEIIKLSGEQKKKKRIDELLSKLNGVNNQFSFSGNGDNESAVAPVELDRMNFSGKSEEEIKKQAELELDEYKNSSVNQIKNENKLKQDSLNENKESAKEVSQDQKNMLSGYYESAKENASNEALKRGLARSSIVINQLDAFDNSQINDYKKIDQDLSNKIQAINFELSGLGGELDKALADFNISYAVELQNKINNLNTDLSKQEQEVIKYNNEIALKEAEFNKKLEELQNDLNNSDWEKGVDIMEVYGKYGNNIVSKIIQDNIYRETKNYLNTLSQAEALDLLNDENIKAQLGSSYQALLKEFGG